MKYLYKLIDKTAEDYLNGKGVLSLSRPFYVFKSEIKGVEIIKNIYDRTKNLRDSDTIFPEVGEIEKIERWIKEYYDSLPDEERNRYSSYTEAAGDIVSDLRILMTQYFQTYCGYCTDVNLSDADIRKGYLSQSSYLTENKCAYVKIPVEGNHLRDGSCWISGKDDITTFEYDEEQSYDVSLSGIKAVLHIQKNEYSSGRELRNPFTRFNGNDERRISSLLKYIKSGYSYQSEQRLMLTLFSSKAGDRVTAFHIMHRVVDSASVEERIFYILLDLMKQAEDYPKYVYMKLDKFEISAI